MRRPYKGDIMTTSSSVLPDSGQARLGLVVLIAGAITISFSGIFVKLSELGPSATAFYRLFFALPVFWLWLELEARGPLPPTRPTTWRDYGHLAVAGLFLAGDLAFWHWALTLSSVANATLLGNAAPIFVTLAGWLFFRERFTPAFLAGLLLSIVGAVGLIGGSFSLSVEHLLGDLFGVVTAVFYAGYIIAVKRLRAQFSTATIMIWSGIATCAALLVIALLSGESLIAHSLYGWGILIGLALLSQAGGQSMIAWALAHLPAAFSSVSLLINPVAAAIFAWIILGEAIGPLQAAAGLVVLAGIALARRGSRAKPVPEATI